MIPEPTPRKVFRVGEIAIKIKALLEQELGQVWVEGEISGFKQAPTGHMYFDLKDESAVLNCCLFRGNQRGLKAPLANGQHVRAQGTLTSYPPRSNYQLIARLVEPVGKGTLQEQFELMKARLMAEGLFDATRKRPLPFLPRRIGIVTSLAGAALRDMLSVLTRRYADRHILIAPSRVQGQGAAQEIVAALDLLASHGHADVMIVGRGGGSMEDLWCFNEEIVARAIARCPVPVISAVGHETDFTIADFVADVRAPTPSAAAEIVVRPKADLEQSVDTLRRQLAQALRGQALRWKNRLTRAAGSYVFREPHHLLRQHRRHVAQLQDSARKALQDAFTARQQQVDEAHMRLMHRMQLVAQRREAEVRQLALQLRALSTQSVLERGYSITYCGDRIVRQPADVRAGDRLRTRLASGEVQSDVTSTGGTVDG